MPPSSAVWSREDGVDSDLDAVDEEEPKAHEQLREGVVRIWKQHEIGDSVHKHKMLFLQLTYVQAQNLVPRTHNLVPNLPLTLMWKLRFRIRSQLKTNINGRFGTRCWVTLYSSSKTSH